MKFLFLSKSNYRMKVIFTMLFIFLVLPYGIKGNNISIEDVKKEKTSKLIEIIKDKTIPSITRAQLVYILEQRKDKSAVPYLLDILKDRTEDLGLRTDIARTLGKIGDNSIAKDLSEILQNEKDDIMVTNLIWSLGELGDNSTIKVLEDFAGEDLHKKIRIASNIARIKQRMSKDEIGYLISQLNTASNDITNDITKVSIISKLAITRDPRAIETIIAYGIEADNASAQYPYLVAFYSLGEAAIGPLLEKLKNREVKTCRFVAKALGFAMFPIADKSPGFIIPKDIRDKVVPHLVEVLKDEDKITQLNAAYSLAVLKRKDGLELAIEGLKSNDWEIVVASADVLGWIEEKKGLDAMSEKLNRLETGEETIDNLESVVQSLRENISRVKNSLCY